MPDKRGARSQRTEQLLKPAGNYTYGSDHILGLIRSARLLLESARNERISRDRENFLTACGPSAILLAVTSFESFLNEALHTCLRTLHDPTGEFESLARFDTLKEKFVTIPRLVAGAFIANADVDLVQHVRNEIVHYYPRHVGTVSNVPEWLEPLAELKLLYSIGAGKNDIGWQQKLGSFQLARWCAGTVAKAAFQFAEAISRPGRDGQTTLLSISVPYMDKISER